MPARVRKRGADAFTARVTAFSEGLKKAKARNVALAGRDTHLEQLDLAARTSALEVLRVQHEELCVAEEELRAQVDELTSLGVQITTERERYTDLFERTRDGVLVTDLRGVIRDANVTALAILDTELRFVRGKPIVACATADASKVLRLIATVEQGLVCKSEIAIQARRGVSVRVLAEVGFTSRGKRLLWILRPVPSADDTEEGRDLRRVLRDKIDLLARETARREELERTNRAKDKFIAVLSHDLRAPLNAILGWTQLLRREKLDAFARNRALETIERNARAQANLIEELLDISRMAADRLPLALAPVDLGVLASRAVENMSPRSKEKGVPVTIDVEPELTVMGDRQRLDQVLENLLANALKFTPAGGTIAVAAKRSGPFVELSVTDTGVGIGEEMLGRVFEMYTQDEGRPAARDGLGLGLYIVKRLVELHDGSVSVASEGKGRGTTFTIRLPLRGVEAPISSSRRIVAPSDLRDVRVLVVDDEDDSRELVVTILRRAGASVAAAAGARAAVELFAHFGPDAVVSDLEMPDGDGCDLLATLRKLDPAFAAIAVSGFAMPRDADRALAAGFDVHLAKPLEAAELVDAIVDWAPPRR